MRDGQLDHDLIVLKALSSMAAAEEAARLSAAYDAVQMALRNEAAHALFAKPVDHAGLKLTDYLDVIGHTPMDLGTILQRLKDGKRSNFRRGSHYTRAADVLADAQLAFGNCAKYNSGPGSENETIRKMAAEARNSFLTAWEAAGLDGPKPKAAPKPKIKAKAAPVKAKEKSSSPERSPSPPPAPRVAHPKVLPPDLPPLDPAACLPESAVPDSLNITSGGSVQTHDSLSDARVYMCRGRREFFVKWNVVLTSMHALGQGGCPVSQS